MTQFYAQPYDISATGFYFETIEEYDARYAACKNHYGESVEEFEIQFIDGESIDAQLFKALGIHRGDISSFIDAADSWDDEQKIHVIIAVGECGYQFDISNDTPEQFDITLYEAQSMKELAEQFVDEGLYGEIPESLQYYIDYDAIARDLSIDYSHITIGNQHYIYHCA